MEALEDETAGRNDGSASGSPSTTADAPSWSDAARATDRRRACDLRRSTRTCSLRTCTRPDMPDPDLRDQDVRRAADVELPALAARVLGARLRGHALARLRRGASCEQALAAYARRQRAASAGDELVLVADPGRGRSGSRSSLSADVPRRLAGCSALALVAALIALHELYWMTRTLRPVVLAGYLGAPRSRCSAPSSAGTNWVLARRVRDARARVRASRARGRARRRRSA